MGEVRQHRVERRNRAKHATLLAVAWKLMVLFAWVASGCTTIQTDVATPWEVRELEVPLFVHVATTGDGPVVDRARIDADVARTNAELDVQGIRFVVARVEQLEIGHAVLQAREQRAEFARRIEDHGALHVFYVRKCSVPRKGNVDQRVSGLHWIYRGLRQDLRHRMYLVVAHDAPSTTLAHEIGHAFGLPHEQEDPTNIMCSCERRRDSHFSDSQAVTLRDAAFRFDHRAAILASR